MYKVWLHQYHKFIQIECIHYVHYVTDVVNYLCLLPYEMDIGLPYVIMLYADDVATTSVYNQSTLATAGQLDTFLKRLTIMLHLSSTYSSHLSLHLLCSPLYTPMLYLT